jgi:predicted acylesterase/phospholipase RssA
MSEKKYDLVFEGGGAKGAAFVGAMEAFYARKCNIRRLVGTSAGAITATLLAAGFTPDELSKAVSEKKGNESIFASFLDAPERSFFSDKDIQESDTLDIFKSIDASNLSSVILYWIKDNLVSSLLHISPYRQLFNFIEFGGLFAGEEFRRWIQGKLKGKGYNNPEITLVEFYNRTQIDLSLVASNTSKCRMMVLNHRTAPDCPLVWAVRMSMSIPFVWSEVVWRKEWGAYLGEDMTGDRIVDGGILSNFPLFLVEKEEKENAEKKRIMGGGVDDDGAGTIGLLIDENLLVQGQPEKRKTHLSSRLKTVKRIDRLVDTMRTSHDNEIIKKKPELVCHLPAMGYGTTEFDMPDHRLADLIAAGRDAMDKYLNDRKVHP